MMRTHYTGQLSVAHVDEAVILCGWVDARRDHGGVAFIDLRDAKGLVQIVIDPQEHPEVHKLRSEYVIQIRGTVRKRPDGTENPDLPTGEIEIPADTLEILSEADALPFSLDQAADVEEVNRMKYRYLDLRRPHMQHNLRLRALVNDAIRRAMIAQDFVELETPMLVASTPEGARDFVVPSRLSPGEFYALPQSPQLFKQLLMVGGFDRYFQIARCLRDEDLRADRQFEFMQLDVEMSFASPEDVRGVITKAVQEAVETLTGESAPEIAEITWQEAQDRFGSDKPDLRFGMELTDVSEVFANTEFNAFRQDVVKAICVSSGAEFSRSQLDALTEQAKKLGAVGLVWMRVQASGIDSPAAKFLSESEVTDLVKQTGATPGDLLLLVAGERHTTNAVLGSLRNEIGRPPVDEGGLQFVWVTDFPLFESEADGAPVPAHHPFTSPHPDDIALLDVAKNLLDVRALAYDLVLNGWELGSGSVRIHRRELQEKVFTLLGITSEQAQERFGFLLDAFRFGPPPHAGFALGLDRFVAILAGEENIREVIAFPKTQSGVDPLTNAPSEIDPDQLKELGLRTLPKK